ncbi:MAG: hypothetical protein TREMPRED_003283 [Tremellales sp. Tagirdzhanova-0007]|nr:MAG: hypothetical protein TREMPRED_003283 [Tremellales sp. Tagirdzhanova-0007]
MLGDQTALPADIMNRLDQAIKDPGERRQFAIWHDIVCGVGVRDASISLTLQLCFKTLATLLQNQVRQRRDYHVLSFGWYERAAMAERFSGHPAFSTVALALHAARLDCLLEAALSGFTLELITPMEEREAWCLVYHLASGMGQKLVTYSVGHALLSAMPSSVLSLKSTRERFDLRHKWARKIPTLPDGRKVQCGLRPEFEEWCKVRDELDATERSDAWAMGISQLQKARISLSDLGDLVEINVFTVDFRVILDELKIDISETTIEKMKS